VQMKVSITCMNEKMKNSFEESLTKFTGENPFHSEHAKRTSGRKLLKDAFSSPKCGVVEIVHGNSTSSSGIKRVLPTYLYTPCECNGDPPYSFVMPAVEKDSRSFYKYKETVIINGVAWTMDKTALIHDPAWTITRRIREHTEGYPRWDNFASSQYDGVDSYYDSYERLWVAYPYRSHGSFSRYSPLDLDTSDMLTEGRHYYNFFEYNSRRINPDIKTRISSRMGCFSKETMVELLEAIRVVTSVTSAARNGYYMPVDGEFPPRRIRLKTNMCAGMRSFFNQKIKGEFLDGGIEKTRDHCANLPSEVIIPHGLPSPSERLDTAFKMHKLLSDALRKLKEDFLKLENPSERDHGLLSLLSIKILVKKIDVHDYIWEAAAGQQHVHIGE